MSVAALALCRPHVAKSYQQTTLESARTGSTSLPKIEAGGDPDSLARRVDAYVRAITRNRGLSDDASLVRWNTPICARVLGLPAKDSQFLLERLGQISESAGAALADEPCQANLIIVATSDPDRVLSAWYARDKRLFGEATAAQIREFLKSSQPHPVRVWYNIDRGRKSGTRNGHFVPSNMRAESSAFTGNTVFDFFSVFAIIDTGRTGHTALENLADYVSMAGLTNVNLEPDLGSAPSVLRLFSARGEPQTTGLSRWDTAFLKALYQTNQTSRTRRFDIAERVVHELSR